MLSERTRTISALGVIEIFAWGSSFYLPAVLAEPIALDTGWSRGAVTGGVSVGLLAAGLVATRVGRLIQTFGGRPVLAGAMVLIAAGLGLMAAAPNLPVYFAAWLIVGAGMGGGLYDAAFATLGHIYGREARRAITALTLWGGFASTVCWPITAYLNELVGWRGTCLSYAALHLLVTLPLCIFALPRQERAPVVQRPAGGAAGLADLRFWALIVAAVTQALVAAIWSMHLMTVLQATGVSLAAAVALGALIGPAQVGARVIEMASGGRHHPAWTALISAGLLTGGFAGLVAGIPASVALIAYGAGNGLWSIARGSLPMALFGPEDYPVIMGRIARPALFASASAPLLGTWLIAAAGPVGTLWALTATALVPVAVAAWFVLSPAARRSSG